MSSAAVIAQLGERKTEDLKVSGSIPDCGTHFFIFSLGGPITYPTPMKKILRTKISPTCYNFTKQNKHGYAQKVEGIICDNVFVKFNISEI